MPLLPNELARRENGRLELRTGPVRTRWNLDELVTSDGQSLHATFTCSISAINEPAEWKMLEEVFLSRAMGVTTEDVVHHFMPGFRAAAVKVVGKHKAEAWIKSDAAAITELTDALREEGKKIAFTSGLDVLPPFQSSYESPSFEAQQIEELERTLAERRVAGQVEHFERAGKLLRQFEDLRKAAPDLSAADVLKQVSPADQGMMFQTLLLASGKAVAAKGLYAVAGNALVKIDGRATPPALQMIAMPQLLGPLRSVQTARLDGKDVLLVGARSGVIVYDPASGSTREYSDKSIDSQLGFSSAVVWNEQIWACHGDAGIIAWNLLETQTPAAVIRPVELRAGDNPPPLPTSPTPPPTGGYVMTTGAVQSMMVRTAGIRNVTVLDEKRLAFSVGHYLTIVDQQGRRSPVPLESQAEVLAIVPDGKRVGIVQEDGTVSIRDRATLALISSQRRTGRLTAAAVLPWLGAQRLLLATDEGPIYCVGLDDELVTQYLSAHHGLRVASAAADLVAAVSADRQRVVLWNSWDGKKPLTEILVASMTRHRVGDIEFA